MIKVTAPATSANLAVGFDCVGLAVNMQSKFTFSANDEHRLSISGCPIEFQNENNLVFQAFAKVCRYIEQPIPDLRIDIDTEVPVSRGLGSSAACIIGGLVGANQWFNAPLNQHQLLELATAMEGHPDNVAPALFGGLCMAFVDSKSEVQIVKYPVNQQLQFVAIIPNFKISTESARQVLPTKMAYADVTHQVSHSLLMTHAIETGNLAQLKEAMNDRMHEPYRAKLIDHFDQLATICDNMNSALYISGSGSTMMAITDDDLKRDELIAQISKQFPNWQINAVQVDNQGVKSEAIYNR